MTILGKRCIFLHGPAAAEYYLQAPETELSFLKGVDQVLGPFLPVGMVGRVRACCCTVHWVSRCVRAGLFRRIRNDIFSLALRKSQLVAYIPLMGRHLQARVERLGPQGTLDVFQFASELTLELNALCFAGTCLPPG